MESTDSGLLLKTLLKVVLPLLVIAVVLFVAKLRHMSWRDDVGIRRPAVGDTIAWLAVYAALILGSNALMGWRGPWDFSPWEKSPMIVDVMRVLAVGVLGPIAEELLFRGFLFSRLLRTRLGVIGTVVVLAAVWAAMHVDYSAGVIALLFVAGVLLGTARFRTKSVIVPVLMHITWNLYAVW